MEEYKLFDAEYRLMDLVWSLEPVNSTALARRCEEAFGWKSPPPSTSSASWASGGSCATTTPLSPPW